MLSVCGRFFTLWCISDDSDKSFLTTRLPRVLEQAEPSALQGDNMYVQVLIDIWEDVAEDSLMYQRCVGHLGCLLAMVVIILLPTTSWACSVCWGVDGALARGLNTNIVFLMSMPFLIAGVLFGVFYIAQRRQRERDTSSQQLVVSQKENQL